MDDGYTWGSGSVRHCSLRSLTATGSCAYDLSLPIICLSLITLVNMILGVSQILADFGELYKT
ncbi:hypothetical protein T10_6108 [Trichinella papuae]|uniref:Uncharacterized protein n=1 Tax=Trichinella papuae TaxID=268474 RepID=A0A0V1M0H9_9BILA|nr:hypothetical protein T10_6108 [Trichinella papuae]